MAIKIEVPGIGDVTVSGIAEEDTMREILAAVSKSESRKKKEEDELAKSQKALNAKTKETANELDDLIDTTEKLEKEQKESTKTVKEFKTELKDTAVKTAKEIGNFGVSLAATAAGIATAWTTAYDQMAQNPIQAGAKMIETGIDLVNKVAGIGIDAIGGAASGLVGMIPFVGSGMQKVGEAATQAAKEAVNFAAQMAKVANAVLASEFEKTVESMKTFTKAGASFSGGLTEMRDVANESGLGIQEFTQVIGNTRQQMVGMGMSASEASKTLSKGLGALATTTGRSGMAMRDELLALGYSFEQQGELMAQYSANMNASGRLRTMTDKELAAGTAQYAKDLKVLADITGKNAQAAMEEARMASMQADIMAQLTPEEATKFQAAYAAMPDYAKKGFLEYVSSGGRAIVDVSTNIAMSQNAEFSRLIKGTYAGIKDANRDATQIGKDVLKQTSAVSTEQERLAKSGGAVIGMVNTLTGDMADTAKMQNQMISAGRYNADAVDKSAEAAENQSQAQDEVTKGYVKATEATKNFQLAIQNLALENLPAYATMISTTVEETAKAVKDAIAVMKGDKTATEVFEERTGKKEVTQAEIAKQNQAGLKYQENISKTQQGLGQENLQRAPGESEEAYRNRMIELAKRTGNARFDSGGKIRAGQTGLVGEYGPEFVSGPASVLSTVNTDSLIKALDAVREMQGTRLGQNGFDWKVGMNADRWGTLKERIKPFDTGALPLPELQKELESAIKQIEGPDSLMTRARREMGEESNGETTKALYEQNNLLRRMLDILGDNNRLTSGILQNTY